MKSRHPALQNLLAKHQESSLTLSNHARRKRRRVVRLRKSPRNPTKETFLQTSEVCQNSFLPQIPQPPYNGCTVFTRMYKRTFGAGINVGIDETFVCYPVHHLDGGHQLHADGNEHGEVRTAHHREKGERPHPGTRQKTTIDEVSEPGVSCQTCSFLLLLCSQPLGS